MKILGYPYRIIITKESSLAKECGQFNSIKQEISIDGATSTEQRQSTILHEIIEALDYHLELKLEHRVIMSLEAGLFQVLNDNGVNLSPLLKNIK